MLHIVPVPDSRPLAEFDGEPSEAELAAIDLEMPAIRAAAELLDVRISLFDRPLSPFDARRLRRAEHRLLAERARLATAERSVPGVTA